MTDDDLPDDFTVESDGWMFGRYRSHVYRSDGEWKARSTAVFPILPNKNYHPYVIEESHARRLYERYEVVNE